MIFGRSDIRRFLMEGKSDLPSHFGGGENIRVFDYQTKHYDICRSAVMLFERLSEQEFKEHKQLVEKAAQKLDEFFGIEKQVVEEGNASVEDVMKASELLNVFSMTMGMIAEKMSDDYERETGFIEMHLKEIVDRL